MEATSRLRWTDSLLIGVFSLVLFGYCAFSGRPLTMHEARLPQTSREMLATHHWLLPTSGTRPWLERPPLPHWIVVAAMKLTGRTDAVWVVRLPSAVMGTIAVLITAWMAGRWFGRAVGALSGLALASSFEFHLYAGSAEDDIYLAAAVAVCLGVFVHGEFFSARCRDDPRSHVATGRPWQVLAFFGVLGITNIIKGPLLGLIIVGPTVGTYLLWTGLAERRWRPLLRYTWLWGWLLLIGLTLAWPAWAYYRYPGVLGNWKYDYLGRVSGTYTDINQRWWYYGPTLAGELLPWTPAVIVGLLATAGAVFRRSSRSTAAAVDPARTDALRWVWSAALAPLIVLSIPHGKHHHYLIPLLGPWAMLAGLGLAEAGKWIRVRRGPDWLRNPWIAIAFLGLPGAAALAWFRPGMPGPAWLDLVLMAVWVLAVGLLFVGFRRGSGAVLMAVLLGVISVAYCWGETFLAGRTDQTLDDTAFLIRARAEVPADLPLFVNAKLGPAGNLDFFRVQFYSRPNAVLLHNLSFLRDTRITAGSVLVITRSTDRRKLEQLGTVTAVDASAHSHEQDLPYFGPFTLFRLTFTPGLPRYPAPPQITPMQAMERDPAGGPWCGPAVLKGGQERATNDTTRMTRMQRMICFDSRAFVSFVAVFALRPALVRHHLVLVRDQHHVRHL